MPEITCLLLIPCPVFGCRGQDKYDNFLSKGYAQTAISTNVSPPTAVKVLSKVMSRGFDQH
jgi:hypothetical protein